MSAISDYAGRVQTAFDSISAGIDGVSNDVAALKAKIEELQNSPGVISPEDQALLDSLEAMAGALAARINELDNQTVPPVL